jgi:CubicO group peptidase (beta-lactamase class C family)
MNSEHSQQQNPQRDRVLPATRRTAILSATIGLPFLNLAGRASAEPPAAKTAGPGKTWARFPNPEVAGFRSSALEALEGTLYAKATTALMIVKAGKMVYSYGDIAQVSYLASARKSVLSMLYGKYVASGLIDLRISLGDLGINERGEGLLPIEKTATIRDLLMSSSGVYWPAGSPGSDPATPPRGSKKPGTFFLYNNWDFNVAGAIFERLSGKTVFRALAEDLALPLQFEDFDPARQHMLGYQSGPSRYKAYHMFLSGRDMARLGVVMLNGGGWNGQQVIPAAWVKESTALHVKAADVAGPSGMGYGYLWWKPSETRSGPEWVGSWLAYGNYGQFILGLPAMETVIVHRRAVTDAFAIARNMGKTQASPAGGPFEAVAFLAIADMVVAARA